MRKNRRRLEFEPLRDSFLAVADRLDTKAGGRAVDLTTTPFSTRRSAYGFIDRQNLPGLFRTFDFASPDTSSPQRHETTVPQQALFLMNSPLVIEQARHLMERADVQAQKEDVERIGYLYRLLFGRAAEPDEVALGQRLVAGVEKPQTAWEIRGQPRPRDWSCQLQIQLSRGVDRRRVDDRIGVLVRLRGPPAPAPSSRSTVQRRPTRSISWIRRWRSKPTTRPAGSASYGRSLWCKPAAPLMGYRKAGPWSLPSHNPWLRTTWPHVWNVRSGTSIRDSTTSNRRS